MSRVVVICTRCGQLADFEPPSGSAPWGTWYWHQPCRHCGAEEYAAHDTDRDIQTGQLRQPVRE